MSATGIHTVTNARYLIGGLLSSSTWLQELFRSDLGILNRLQQEYDIQSPPVSATRQPKLRGSYSLHLQTDPNPRDLERIAMYPIPSDSCKRIHEVQSLLNILRTPRIQCSKFLSSLGASSDFPFSPRAQQQTPQTWVYGQLSASSPNRSPIITQLS